MRKDKKGLLQSVLLLASISAVTSARNCPSSYKDNRRSSSSSNSTQVVINPPSEVFPRRDIVALIEEPELRPQLDLFIQAYSRIQQRPSSSPVSYFQIASIHGQPYVASFHSFGRSIQSCLLSAKHVQVPQTLKRGPNESRFPVKNLCLSQEVRKEALEIAQKYDAAEREKYLEAARQLRLPYFDWTSERAAASGIPEYTLQQNVTVITPTGQQSIKNPLESFVLPEDVAEGTIATARNSNSGNGVTATGSSRAGDAPSLKGNPTLRHPDIDLLPQYDRLQNDLRSEISQSIRPSWFKLYTDPDIAKSWASFASHAPRTDGRRPVTSLANIEGIHDLVHDILGGIVFNGETGVPGHMSDVDIAAFDPIFFLHHANVDRLTALYQMKNPNTWLEHTNEPHQRTYVTGMNGYTVNRTTPLWPFRKAPDTFFTSDDVRDFESLGYTYLDLLPEDKNVSAGAPATLPDPTNCESQERHVDLSKFKPDEFDGFRWYLNFHDVPTQLCSGSALLSAFLEDPEERSASANVSGSVNSTMFAGSVAIFTHSSCIHCHNGSIDGQIDITQQLLEMGLIELQSEAYYASLSPSAQPQREDRPPPDLFDSFLVVRASCPDGVWDLDDTFKEENVAMTWGRLVNGRQVVGV